MYKLSHFPQRGALPSFRESFVVPVDHCYHTDTPGCTFREMLMVITGGDARKRKKY